MLLLRKEGLGLVSGCSARIMSYSRIWHAVVLNLPIINIITMIIITVTITIITTATTITTKIISTKRRSIGDVTCCLADP